jgi:hypothetical protein
MINEDDMENAIISNPEKYLGEKDLKLISRQFRIGKYIFDLLFEDRHGGKLIVELQKGTLDREHTYKILDYYDEYREAYPGDFIDLMVIANNITHERKKRLSSLGIAFRELPASEFLEVVTKTLSTQDSSSNSIKVTTHQQGNEDIQFELFKRQKNELIKALKDYDPNTKFKREKDPKDVDEFRKNPYFMFYPAEWEISPRQMSGVHFSFYVRGEYARLSVGVESPMRDQYKEKFKLEVVEELKRCQVKLSEFDIWPDAGQTKRKAKLLEVTFPFDNYSCHKAIGYYRKLDAFISIVSEKIKEFKKNGYVK